MSKSFEIKSYKGLYSVHFTNEAFQEIEKLKKQNICLIIDENIFKIYHNQLKPLIEDVPYLVLEANEQNKDLSQFTKYAHELTSRGVKRNITLVAVGGGIIQDITCFLAATLFRGLNWIFFPTTLLAQADSCIGSKSSINVGGIKNLMGTFTPPQKIFIDLNFLKTLNHVDLLSGLGEMIKVHGIAGFEKLSDFSKNYDLLLKDPQTFEKYLLSSLMIKKEIIEIDEFDTGPRLVMNYGHTFGHAVESASDYKIPHGLAITIGQAMACTYSFKNQMISEEVYKMALSVLNKNIADQKKNNINFKSFIQAILKDKKNEGSKISLIIPRNNQFKIEKYAVEADESFRKFCRHFFHEEGYHVIYE